VISSALTQFVYIVGIMRKIILGLGISLEWVYRPAERRG